MKKMKKMKNIHFILLFGIALLVSSCYKEETWVDKNVKEGGKFFPKIASFAKINPGSDFYFGDEIDFELNYWSQDDVDSIYLLENGIEYNRIPYESAYSKQTHMDSTILTYTAHELNAKSIVIASKVVNVNKLESSSSSYELVTCPKDLKTEYSSTGNLSYDIYFKLDSTTIDTISIDSSFEDINLSLQKIDDNNYYIDDLLFGFAKLDGGNVLKGVTLKRDVCHFTADTSFYDLSSADTTFYSYHMTGIVTPDKVFSVDWHIDVSSSSKRIWGTIDGNSELK